MHNAKRCAMQRTLTKWGFSLGSIPVAPFLVPVIAAAPSDPKATILSGVTFQFDISSRMAVAVASPVPLSMCMFGEKSCVWDKVLV